MRRTDRPISREKQSPGADAPGGTPRLALPAGLARSLRYLDDGQLDELMRAVSAEARRRGWQSDAVGPDGAKKPGGRMPRSRTGTGKRSAPLTVGQENLIRAASEAGLGAAAIAREFRLSRAQVESVIRAARRRG